ncbi:MAG: ABC transporter ATP-binding protein [Patescibacteria group bacterium]
MEKQIISKQAVRQVLKDYWQQYKNYPVTTLIAFFLPAIGVICTSFIPPLIIARLINLFIEQGMISLSSVTEYIILFGGVWLFGESLWRTGMHLLIKLEAIGMNILGKKAFRLLTKRDYDFYTNNFVGSLTKKAAAFSRNFEAFTDTLIFNVVTNILPIVFAVIILARYSPWIPLLLVVSITIVATVSFPIVRHRSKLVALRHESSSRVSGRMSDAMTNMLAIKSFAKEQQEQETFGQGVDEYTSRFKKTADYQNLHLDVILSPLYVLTNVVGLITAIFFTQSLGLQAGTIVVVFAYYTSITRIFWEINRIYRNLESSISEAAEFTQLFLEPPTVQDKPGASELHLNEASINFKDVDFKYDGDGSGELFLAGLNLEIKARERVGLVGPSGGGKTTITKLLLRFINLQSGEIAIDNQDISQVTQRSLREAIAYVPQEPLLFHRSLFENIAYGDERATEEAVKQAAKLARADEFIDKLPHGYQTLVGERGIKLSGGQRQRIAIARAILKKAPILVLDEATSSLDSESEKYIQAGLWELMKDRTALVIAHRLSTIKHLDRIIVLEEGKIVQDGTHDDLIKEKGLYAKLWSHQSGEFLED